MHAARACGAAPGLLLKQRPFQLEGDEYSRPVATQQYTESSDAWNDQCNRV